jgi:hypothetical protein
LFVLDFAVIEIESRTLHMLGKRSSAEMPPHPKFLEMFKMRSLRKGKMWFKKDKISMKLEKCFSYLLYYIITRANNNTCISIL